MMNQFQNDPQYMAEFNPILQQDFLPKKPRRVVRNENFRPNGYSNGVMQPGGLRPPRKTASKGAPRGYAGMGGQKKTRFASNQGPRGKSNVRVSNPGQGKYF
mmetsp:Transcript_13132/g.20406  ORF Transcript_13132/g.20406 Transcript_13132/m.20406 type:complete len:102 (+) Transcript_13132:16-321(+)